VANEPWYFCRNGQQLGPFSRLEIESFIALGRVLPTDDVWTGSLHTWKAASDVFGFGNGPRGPLPVSPRRQSPSSRVFYSRVLAIVAAATLMSVAVVYSVYQYVFIGSAPAGATRSEKLDALELLKLSFECGSNSFVGNDTQKDHIQTEFSGDIDRFVSHSHLLDIKNGETSEANIDLVTRWGNVVHLDVLNKNVILYCRNCTIETRLSPRKFLMDSIIANTNGARKSTLFSFCDVETAKNASSAIEKIVELPLSSWVFDPPNAPVKEDNLFIKSIVGGILKSDPEKPASDGFNSDYPK
jgi:hypothetical protein